MSNSIPVPNPGQVRFEEELDRDNDSFTVRCIYAANCSKPDDQTFKATVACGLMDVRQSEIPAKRSEMYGQAFTDLLALVETHNAAEQPQ